MIIIYHTVKTLSSPAATIATNKTGPLPAPAIVSLPEAPLEPVGLPPPPDPVGVPLPPLEVLVPVGSTTGTLLYARTYLISKYALA